MMMPHRKRLVLIFLGIFSAFFAVAEKAPVFSVLPYDYFALQKQSDADVKSFIAALQSKKETMDRNQQVQFLSRLMQDRPYLFGHPEGEGDACRSGGLICDDTERVHIQQNPIYRTDGFNCQTFVQMVLALLDVKDFQTFQKKIIAVSYGGAGLNHGVRFYNRNHFISLDFNPVNESLHYIKDVTKKEILHLDIKTSSARIDKSNWFAFMRENVLPSQMVQVIHAKDGLSMFARWQASYPESEMHFSPQIVPITYIPKTAFFFDNNPEKINQTAINQLPTPAILEIVRDPKKCVGSGKCISELIGTELNVPHLGLLYREHFLENQKIGDAISMQKNKEGKAIAHVQRIVCHQAQGCDEVMFSQASNVFPNDFYFYQDKAGQAHCETIVRKDAKKVTYCNRVYAMPFQYYLKSFQYGEYSIMNPVTLGFHVEQIL